MIFSSNFDCRKVNPFIYINFWSQACLPFLLYGSEPFTFTSSLLAKLERCQQWFLKNILYVPNFAPIRLILKLSGLNSIESEIVLRNITNNPILNLTPENITQHSRIEGQLHTKEAQHPLK